MKAADEVWFHKRKKLSEVYTTFSNKVPELYRGTSVLQKAHLIFGNKMLTPGFQTETLPSHIGLEN